MIFTIWNKIKHKKFKQSTLLDFLIVVLLLLCWLLWNEVSAEEGYEYLYNGEPRIRQQWAYRIDQNCPAGYEELIRGRMEIMEPFFDTRFLSTTNVVGSGDVRDGSWIFWCSDDFSQPILKPLAEVNHLVEEIKDQVSNATLGRAHIYWSGSSMIEVDIQLSTELTGADLQDTIDHEIGHGAGCAHNTGNIMALMYPSLLIERGWHIEDLQCLNYLYGPLPFAIRDYRNNVLLPQAIDMSGLKGWAILSNGSYQILEYGE